MSAAFPSLTKTWHNDTYAAIDPRKRPELQLKGKTVVISGGGSGVGKGLTRAFAAAGAANIAILARRENVLQETKAEVEKEFPGSKVSPFAVDLVNLQSVEKAAEVIGSWDVLISNAGYLSSIASLEDSDPEDWWRAFEVNIKGTYNLAHAFLPKRNAGSTLIGINAGSIQADAMAKNYSSYNSSKMALLKILQTIADETPDLHVVSLHPGIVESDMTVKTFGSGKMPTFDLDSPELPGHTAVWLCSNEARFLRGKFVWANWDAEELLQKKAHIEGSPMLTINCIGWPYSP